MPVKVLVVDDSLLIRRLVTRMLEEEKDIQVIGQAADGLEAIEMIKKLKPQVVTMDVEMPKLDGIATLRRVMRECPVPVIMLSAYTTAGARATMEALALGAVDFVGKPMKPGQLGPMIADLKAKIRVAAGVSLGKVAARPAAPPKPPAPAPAPGFRAKDWPRTAAGKIELVVIGCSTGGPAALQNIIPRLPANLPVGVVVVQHIPVGFSKSLSEHLNRKSAVEVIHGHTGDEVRPGRVIVAPAGCETHFIKSGGKVTVKLEKCNQPIPPATFRPSVDQVMTAATKIYKGNLLGVLLTGMGRDGAQGMLEIRKLGGRTIAQDEASCVVYGMPKAAIDLGAAEKISPLNKIAQEILDLL
ncbi:protein-glutamate methylesterase/protein-glutamine glutaminase [Desulfofalx alkaliphila]|uniref:protein-glutamate methylesterase/protein-glutamine glutaminase n=1 Tax=Desulfofalx alkaliphila TaxID=105483 RepID=UPI0004E26F10|nr:chemotaxis response regulator protein-glutamate methylesterase [Desulfofalx alkaliphila]